MASPQDVTTQQAGGLLYAGKMVDHFKVVRLIGRGGMSEVYLARDTKLGRKVALKVVHPESLGSAEALQRFLFEAQTTARFNHPHIVTIYAVGEEKGKPYVALEYLEGQTLRQRIDEDRPSLVETMRIAAAIADALREAHLNGVLHRDLKPENIMIPRDGRLRVLDFGLAKAVSAPPAEALAATVTPDAPTTPAPDASTTPASGAPGGVDATVQDLFRSRAQGARGTPGYMAPEQWREEACTAATDMWALGVILHELLTGRRPYEANTLVSLACKVTSAERVPTPVVPPDTPAELVRLIDRCLAKDLADRPTAAEAVTFFEGLLHPGRAASSGEERNPFRGLLPFAERHARFFFGREAEIDAFLERMREQPILPVVGPSGAGKSSFVQAGVLPRLREQGAWLLLRLRPGVQPFVALASRLLLGESTAGRGQTTADPSVTPRPDGPASTAALSEAPHPQALAQRLLQTPTVLALRLHQLAEERRCKVLLFVDQLEELYTLGQDEQVRRAFMEAICTAADDPAEPVRVIFTLRDDYLGRLAEGAAAREVLGRLTVMRTPGHEALEQILSRPVEEAGYSYDEPSLVAEMLRAVRGEPASLPLLQFTTALLWERRDEKSRQLLRSAYDAMGGVAGALAEHADGVLEGLTLQQLRVARDLLLRLVTPEETRRVLGRERALEGLEADGSLVLDRLVQGRLISVRRAQRDDRTEAELELVHESLIRSWGRLRRWIEEGREELSMLAQASQAAELWDKRGRRDAELWQGDALQEARRTLERCARVPEQVQRFLDAATSKSRRRTLHLRLLVTLIIVVLIAVAAVLARQRRLAVEQKEYARRRWAEAQLEGARAALAQGRMLEARAKLRGSLETRDSALGRALWRRLGREPLLGRKRLGDAITKVAFSPDGRTIAAASLDKSIYLLDAETVAVLRMLHDPEDRVFSIAYSPDGQLLASGTRQGRIRLWNVAGGTIENNLRGHRSTVWGLAFSPDGRQLASASEDRTLRLWDVPGGAPRRVLSGHEDGVLGVAFTPDGRLLVSGSFDRSIRVWDAATGAERRRLTSHAARIYDVAVSPDGAVVASAGLDKQVHLIDLRSGQTRAVLAQRGRALSVAFSPDGRLLASGTADRVIQLWDVATGAGRGIFSGHKDWVRDVAFSPDGRHLASASPDKSVLLWEASSPTLPRQAMGHRDRVFAVAFAPDGRRIASASADRSVRLWDAASGREEAVLLGHSDWVRCVAFSPDGRLVAAGASEAAIRIWDASSGVERQVLTGHAHRVHGVSFSPDGQHLASASADTTVRVWDLSGVTPPRVLAGHSSTVKDVAFSPDGRRLASSSEDGTVRLWAWPGGAAQRTLRHEAGVTSVAFSRDGRQLLSGSQDETVRLWDLARQTSRLVGRAPGSVYSVALSPDGLTAASTSTDGVVQLWELGSGRVSALRGHRSEVYSVRFAGDGRLVTGGGDGTVRLWRGAVPVWRAPLLAGAELFTHRGWLGLPPSPATGAAPSELLTLSVSPARWRAVIAEARDASVDGGTLCVQTRDDRLEIWDRRADRRLSTDAAPGLERALALPDGCVALARGRVRFYRRSGAYRDLLEGASAVAVSDRRLLVATAQRIAVFDEQGRRREDYPGQSGVRALIFADRRLVLGLENGNLALVHGPRGPVSAYPFGDSTSRAVVQLAPGPAGAVVVGHANGSLVVRSLADGAWMDSARLHGPVTHLAVVGSTLLAVSELGDTALLDLSVFSRGRCGLLRELWRRIPVIWGEGQAVRRAAPSERVHPCVDVSQP